MGKLFKRGNTFYADLRAEGQGKPSLHTSDRQVAKARLRAAELGTTGGPATSPKGLAAAIDQMVTLKRLATGNAYKRNGLHLIRLLGATADINKLTRAQVADYTVQRAKEDACRHTVHKELVALRQTLKEAKTRGEYGGSLDVVPQWSAEYEPRRRWLTPDQFRKIVAAAAVRNRTWLMLQVFTSAGYGEVRRMTWEHIDFENDVVTVPGTKRTSRHRTVPLHAELRAWLEKADRSKPLVARWRPHLFLRETCDKLKMPRATPTDLRRTFGSWLKQAGVDSLHVAKMMGHSSTTMVDRVYGQLSTASYAAAMARMPAVFSRPTGVPPARKNPNSKRRSET